MLGIGQVCSSEVVKWGKVKTFQSMMSFTNESSLNSLAEMLHFSDYQGNNGSQKYNRLIPI